MAIEATTTVAAESSTAQPNAGSTAAAITPEQAERNTATRRAIEAERKAEKLEAQIKADADARDVEKGNYQKLWSDEKARADGLEQKHAFTLKRSALLFEATKLGLIDPDALGLVDMSKMQIEGDAVKGAAETAAEFFKAKPHNFKTETAKPNSANTKPAPPGGGQIFDPLKVNKSDVWGLSPAQLQEVMKR